MINFTRDGNCLESLIYVYTYAWRTPLHDNKLTKKLSQKINLQPIVKTLLVNFHDSRKDCEKKGVCDGRHLCLLVFVAVFTRVVKIRSLLVNARTIENLESLQSGSRNFRLASMLANESFATRCMHLQDARTLSKVHSTDRPRKCRSSFFNVAIRSRVAKLKRLPRKLYAPQRFLSSLFRKELDATVHASFETQYEFP